MRSAIPREVLTAFIGRSAGSEEILLENTSVLPIRGGLINRSYKVSCPARGDFFLQQVNKQVFERPDHLQENYTHIWQYAEFEFTGIKIPAPVDCNNRSGLYVDQEENYWRAFEFMGDTVQYKAPKNIGQVKATVKAFAKFTAAFDDFHTGLLKEVIPGFHNLSLRYNQFQEALTGDRYERMAKAVPLINELNKRQKYVHLYEIITESDEFLKRVMHHDAKISNTLFCATTGKVVCVVDLDTVMPGYFFSDLGDMIRSMACPKDENAIDAKAIVIRKEFYDTIINIYLAVMGQQLTNAEKKHIHYAGLLMIYMQSMRFLTDYLEGDVYYQTEYNEQNFDRANNQFQLLQQLEELIDTYYTCPK